MKLSSLLPISALCIVLSISSPALAFKGMGAPQGGMGGAEPGQLDEISVSHDNIKAVVARVNGAEITMGSLMKAIQQIIMEGYGGKKLTEGLAKRVRSEALERLALEELAYQHAVSQGVKVEADQINALYERKVMAQGGQEAYLKMLETNNQTPEDIKEEIKRYLAVRRIIIQEIDKNLEATEKEIEEAYLANRDSFTTPERVVATDIIFFLDPADPDSMNKVQSIRSRLLNELGGDTSKLNPDGFLVQNDIDLSQKGEQVLSDAAKKIEVGGISEPLISEGTMHLIKLDSYQARQDLEEEAAKKIVARKIKSGKRAQLLVEWRQNLLKEAKIEVYSDLLKFGSDDTNP